MIYVGRQAPKTPDLGAVSALLVRAGYSLCTHSYALSRRGLQQLSSSLMATTILHAPQDVTLAAMALGSHPLVALEQRIREICPRNGEWVALAFHTRDECFPDPRGGLTTQLGALECSRRASSQCQDFVDGRPTVFNEVDREHTCG
mmetsp:Transcript_9668/g.22792  ORF Transcript_9668/g.22792 Transcript_9668/m.22792 type:complete len:146 (-) Transcript_9668:78-515(-)